MTSNPPQTRRAARERPEAGGTATDREAVEILEKAETVSRTMTGAANEAYAVTAAKVGEFNDDVMRLVGRHPKQSVLISFGVGCMVGVLLCGGFAEKRR